MKALFAPLVHSRSTEEITKRQGIAHWFAVKACESVKDNSQPTLHPLQDYINHLSFASLLHATQRTDASKQHRNAFTGSPSLLPLAWLPSTQYATNLRTYLFVFLTVT